MPGQRASALDLVTDALSLALRVIGQEVVAELLVL
jgi:hypothetical protein